MQATVRDVMTTKAVAVRQGTPSEGMATMLRNCKVSAFRVPDEHGAFIGVVCEAGLLAKEALDGTGPGRIAGMLVHREQASADGVTAAAFMSKPAVTTGPGVPATDPARLMYVRRMKRLPVGTGSATHHPRAESGLPY